MTSKTTLFHSTALKISFEPETEQYLVEDPEAESSVTLIGEEAEQVVQTLKTHLIERRGGIVVLGRNPLEARVKEQEEELLQWRELSETFGRARSFCEENNIGQFGDSIIGSLINEIKRLRSKQGG